MHRFANVGLFALLLSVAASAACTSHQSRKARDFDLDATVVGIAACRNGLDATQLDPLRGYDQAIAVAVGDATSVELIAWNEIDGQAGRFHCDDDGLSEVIIVRGKDVSALADIKPRLQAGVVERHKGEWRGTRLGATAGGPRVHVLVARAKARATVRKVLDAADVVFAPNAVIATDTVSVTARRPIVFGD